MTSLVLLAAATGGTSAAAMPGNVGSWMIQGGWGYVWAAYGIFWAGLILYTLSLFLRTRALDKEQV